MAIEGLTKEEQVRAECMSNAAAFATAKMNMGAGAYSSTALMELAETMVQFILKNGEDE